VARAFEAIGTGMRLACWLFLAWHAAVAGWLEEAKKQAAALEAARQWDQAANVYQASLTRLGDSGSCQDRFWLLTSLAEVSFDLQHYDRARGWLQQAERSVCDPARNSPESGRLLNAWGALHLVEGNLTAAERELSQAVEASPADELPNDLAVALHNLAAVEMHRRHLAEAAAHEEKALAMFRQQFGDRHYYVMKAQISLSSLQGFSGDWRAAAATLEAALAVEQTPEALANYAIVLDKLNRHRQARKIRRRSALAKLPMSALADVHELGYETGGITVRTR